MDEKKFKKDNKPPACTLPPWANLISIENRDDILRKIKQETVQNYGYSMEECPKRMVCIGKTCLGRPLPHNSITAKPYIDKLRKTHKFNNDNELLVSNCNSCSIYKSCTSTCAQITDYMKRDKVNEPHLLYKDNFDNSTQEPERIINLETLIGKGRKIPWDCLPEKRKLTVEKYLYQQKDFLTIAKELGYTDQKNAQYAFWAALTTLSEYAAMRKFFEDNKGKIDGHTEMLIYDLYLNNMSITDIAKIRGVSKQSLQQKISRLIKKYDIKWQVFVKKSGNKLIYNTAEAIK